MANGQGIGRMGGGGAGPGGECVCQACSHREPHQQGQPCNQKKCPKCGQTMIVDKECFYAHL